MRKNLTALATTLALALAIPALAAQEEFHWTGKVAPGGAVEIKGVNGGVEIEAGGTARATTVNGGISARLGRADWAGLLKLTTVNGGIDVAVPAGLNTEIKASTVNGDIQTDFPVTMTGRISKRHVQGTIGSGGRQLEMETVNGSIELKKATR